MASSQSFSMIRRRMFALSLPRRSGEQRTAVVDLGDPAAERRVPLHLRQLVGEEQHLAVARTGDQRVLGVARVLDQEAVIPHPLLAAHPIEVGLPTLSVGRVREHEIELARRKCIVRERRVLRAAHDVVGGLALALEEQVGLAYRVGLGVDLLAVEVRGHLLPPLLPETGAARPPPRSTCRRSRRPRRRAGRCRTRCGRRWAGIRASP